jgi:hypothetical protein
MRGLLTPLQRGVVAAFAVLLVVIVIVGVAASGAFDSGSSSSVSPATPPVGGAGSPSGEAPPAGGPPQGEQIPPQVEACLQKQGYDITTPQQAYQLYATRPQVIEACVGSEAGHGSGHSP